jgi:hypothetical protein
MQREARTFKPDGGGCGSAPNPDFRAKLNRRTGTPPTSLGGENEWPVAPIGGVVTGHKKAESSSWLMMAMTDSVV